MYIYVPSRLAEKPPIVVAIHYCTGTAEAYYSSSPYAQFADQKDFIRRQQQFDRQHVVMVNYTLNKYNGDASKVFCDGYFVRRHDHIHQNVMAATCPEMFAAGIVYSGVTTGCFYSQSGGTNQWNSSCANGQARHAPGLGKNGLRHVAVQRPAARMQIYHGSADTTLNQNNSNETIKQFGAASSTTTTPSATPRRPTRPPPGIPPQVGRQAVGVYVQGLDHSVPIRGADDMKFFGL
ncbi:hypothetical protein VTK56DRAFT_902 [Thermocarpiscus australiensis]